MNTATVTILATDTTEALPADTLALGVAAFGTIWQRHFPGDEIPSEMPTAHSGPTSAGWAARRRSRTQPISSKSPEW